jgi:hypothetical protein
MKFKYAMFFALLVVVAAVSPLPAHAGAGKIIIKAPDPTCPPPAGYQSIASDGLVSNFNPDEPYVQGGSVPLPVDGSTPWGDNEFANCTGKTIDVLSITVDDIPLGKLYAVLLSGNAFDGFALGPVSNNTLTLVLYCDPSFFTTACTGLSGVAGSDNGVQMIVDAPEPADGALLLFGIGGIALLGLSGRKIRKQLVTA